MDPQFRTNEIAILQQEVLARRRFKMLGIQRHRAPSAPVSVPTEDMASQDEELLLPAFSASTNETLSTFVHEEIQVDSIKTEYHPSSGKPSTIVQFADYNPRYGEVNTDIPINPRPWYPFKSRRDYEASRLPVDCHLSKDTIAQYFRNFHNGPNGPDPDISASDFDSWRRVMEAALSRHGEFQSATFTCPIDDKHDAVSYTVWYRDIWQWFCEVMDDVSLGPMLVWDPVRLSKWDGAKWCSFLDEPWTASDFWDYQSTLPLDAKIMGASIYADKTKLSSYGSAQGYPVIGRISNLPVEIRNAQKGIGGGQLIGWLPFPAHNHHFDSTVWATHKRVVWHTAMQYILEPMMKRSQFGQSRLMPALGNKRFHIYPTILSVSADLEEQSMMALTRGARATHPCVVCLCPSTELHRHGKVYPARTTASTQARYANMENMREKDKAALLKEKGERYIKNVFWGLHGFCIYRALKVDRLHVVHDGLYGKHFLPTFIQHLEAFDKICGVAAGVFKSIADAQLAGIPRWRDLNHFAEGFTNITFNDGKKFQDILMQVSYTLHSILVRERDEAGYVLLCALRALLEFDTYLGLEVHTEETLAAGDRAASRFSEYLEKYEQLVDICASDEEEDPPPPPKSKGGKKTRQPPKKPKVKNWSFLKAHMPTHGMDDVRAGGASRGFNTKTGEQMHGAHKKAFQATNFKDTAAQILRAERYAHALDAIKEDIQLYDKQIEEVNRRIAEKEAVDEDEGPSAVTNQHVSVQSPNGHGAGLTTVAEMNSKATEDPAFASFSSKLVWCLQALAQQDPALAPDMIHGSFKIQRYAAMKVTFEHMVDWRTAQDYLKANPDFHRHPRFDGLLVESTTGLFFARLVMIFSVAISGREILLALVHPYTRKPGSTGPNPPRRAASSAEIKKAERITRTDRDLRHYRVRPTLRKETEVIPLRSVIRGAAFVTDFDVKPLPSEIVQTVGREHRAALFDAPERLRQDQEYLVMDLVDSDMFLRMQKITYIGQNIVHDYSV